MSPLIAALMFLAVVQPVWAASSLGVFGGAGLQTNGVLANGASSGTQTSPSPMSLGANVSFIQMSAGFDHACGLDPAGGVWCWGSDQQAQVGDGSNNPQLTPFKITLPKPATFVHAGYQATCAILNDGTARCWGSNANGKLGNPGFTDATYTSTNPVQPGTSATTFLTGVIDIDVAQSYGCASASMGGTVHQLYCWGANNAGQLGNGAGTTTASTTPKLINMGTCTANAYTSAGAATNVSQISSSMDILHVATGRGLGTNASTRGTTCAVNSLGAVFCWGENAAGESGTVSSATASSIFCPSAVSTSTFTATIADVDVGSGVNTVASTGGPCARATDETAYCWGDGNGRLGDGTLNSSYKPVQVLTAAATPLSGVIDVGVANDHNCALRYDGTVYCWGSNNNGEFGNGNTTDSAYAILALQGPTPGTSIFKGAAVTEFATGDDFLLAGAPMAGVGQAVNPANAPAWQMFALPCNPTSSEVTAALGGNFPAACYKLNSGTNGGVDCNGKGWVVDYYKISDTSAPGTYDYVNVGDKLNYNDQGNTPSGGGYWLKSYSQPNAGRMSVQCSTAGGTKPQGTFTNTTYCPSGNCFVYPLSNPRTAGVGNNAWNLAPNPLPYPVDWSSVRVCAGYNPASGGSCSAAYTPCQAANSADASCSGSKANPVLLASNAISIFNPTTGAYHTFNDLLPPTTTANLGYFQSFFVNVGDGVIGRSDVVLLIPAVASSRPPVVGPGAVMVKPGAPSPAATSNRVSPAAASRTAREWSAVLEVYDDARYLSERTANLGAANGSLPGYDGKDVAYFPKPDFVTSNFLYITIPHPEWGAKAGDYVSDYRTPSANGVNLFSFVIHTDVIGGRVRFRLQTDKRTFANCVLNDVSANRGYALSMADFFAGVSITMDSTDKSMQLVCKNS